MQNNLLPSQKSYQKYSQKWGPITSQYCSVKSKNQSWRFGLVKKLNTISAFVGLGTAKPNISKTFVGSRFSTPTEYSMSLILIGYLRFVVALSSRYCLKTKRGRLATTKNLN